MMSGLISDHLQLKGGKNIQVHIYLRLPTREFLNQNKYESETGYILSAGQKRKNETGRQSEMRPDTYITLSNDWLL